MTEIKSARIFFLSWRLGGGTYQKKNIDVSGNHNRSAALPLRLILQHPPVNNLHNLADHPCLRKRDLKLNVNNSHKYTPQKAALRLTRIHTRRETLKSQKSVWRCHLRDFQLKAQFRHSCWDKTLIHLPKSPNTRPLGHVLMTFFNPSARPIVSKCTFTQIAHEPRRRAPRISSPIHTNSSLTKHEFDVKLYPKATTYNNSILRNLTTKR